jgi:hypothetical protein
VKAQPSPTPGMLSVPKAEINADIFFRFDRLSVA